MALTVREMVRSETDIIIEYFQNSTPEHLEMLGVDPTRFPPVGPWRERLHRECELPIDCRAVVLVVWLADDRPVGFSTSDKIAYGEQANMHLHVIEPERRNRGLGAECVRRSVDIYFDRLKLKRLFCEPNAFNVAPNRTLQKAGFKYLKTHMTVPGPFNFHQAVNRWVIEREQTT
jgi:RimJ/RimL family protein N-acetyltransferase